ncbi:MAG: cytochrome c3 family protein [Myxococcales bacterium]
MTPRRTIPAILAALAGIVAATALAAELPKLPKDIALPKAAKSPGVVTFKHTTHVKAESADCTSCHPKDWPMKPGAKKPEIKHKVMNKGELCGKCHADGKSAFNLEECDKCHASED